MILNIKTPRVFEPLLQPARYLGCYGGRGSGKSHFFAEMMIERCVLAKTDAVCVREVQKSLNQSVKKLLENKIADLGVSSMFDIQEAVIKGKTFAADEVVQVSRKEADGLVESGKATVVDETSKAKASGESAEQQGD